MMPSLFRAYLDELAAIARPGDAREESFYPALKSLLAQAGSHLGHPNLHVTVLPKQTEAGNPDFRLWDGEQQIVGYIEAKTPGTDLDRVAQSEQLRRYRETFPNLILTDFYEFRLYRDGALMERVTIGRAFVAQRLGQPVPLERADEAEDLLRRFLAFSLPRSFSAEELAVELARRTRFLRDQVIAIELQEAAAGHSQIQGFYQAFTRYLIAGLTESQFADLYAQTIAYGLFAARTRAGESFNRRLAFDYIPHTVGILRDVFRFISLGDLPRQMAVIVDDIAGVLHAADTRQILHQFYREGKGDDPILHFYETFLARYDPGVRERRGVYYTPEPAVNYIVRGIHALLQGCLGLADGLAAPQVTLLDPAAGTLTFPAQAIQVAVNEFVEKYGEGGKQRFIRDQILANFYAFELMMAPYAIGHMKISFLLEELGYQLGEEERFKLYLTNTLEIDEIQQIAIPGLSSLSEESHLAGQVKQRQPILVMMGNPPYSGFSANSNEWTEKLLKTALDGAQSYYTVDGQPLGERNPKWLQDDYVKFLRFAQWKIQQAGQGVVGMITNHSYLDNPTFRGMRQSLMGTFNRIYILDLHGNSLKRERTPDGGPDENIFDIRQGVAILFLVKEAGGEGCQVFAADRYGRRAEKYAWLERHDLESSGFQAIQPRSPYYFFVARHTDAIRHYQDWPRINQIFPVNSVGIVTSRDGFVIDFERSALENRIRQFRGDELPDAIVAQAHNLREKSTWRIRDARRALRNDPNWEEAYQTVLYRPFDQRSLYYHDALIERSRREVMQHMLAGENLALMTCRQIVSDNWQHILIANAITDDCLVSNKTRERGYLFPLYLYPDSSDAIRQADLFAPATAEKRPNLAPALLEALAAAHGQSPTPEAILHYIYALFYSPTYRQTYADYLRVDFPRVPFSGDRALFQQIAALGQRLTSLHLLTSPALSQPVARYQGAAPHDRIDKIVYDEAAARVYINADKYFAPVPPALWRYQIGGYQVLHKYLKDRQGQPMADPRHYLRILTALSHTLTLQEEIDALYPAVEESVLAVQL